MLMRADRDRAVQYVAAFFFSISLGISGLVFPLFALDLGHSATVAGLLLALSAATQVLTRWHLGTVMRLVSNASLVTGAAVVLAVANLILAVTGGLLALVVSSALQGVARACFWTGNQVHIVRSERSTATGIATLNLVATLAMLVGPVIGGLIAQRSLPAAFGVAAAAAAVGVVPTFLLSRPPPFETVGGHSYLDLLKHPTVRLGVWASIAVGLWRGILGSYVPIGLDEAGSSEVTIGVVIAIANAAVSAGGFLARRVDQPRLARTTASWSALIGVTTAIVGFGLDAWIIAVALVLGGAGIGLIQVLAITAVSESVHSELRGDAVTLAGVARGVTLSTAPLGVAGLLLVMSLGPAVLVVTALLVGPTVLFSTNAARS